MLSPETTLTIRREGKRLRKAILAEFDIGDRGGLEILERAVESFVRMKEAEEIVKVEGLCVVNRFGEKKEHPAVVISRKERAAFLAAIKQLGLDVLPENHTIGRPPGGNTK